MRQVCAFSALLITALASGCAPPANAPGPRAAEPSSRDLQVIPIDGESFAPSVRALLEDRDKATEDPGRLAGVVRYLFRRAEDRFAQGHDEEGFSAVTAALYMVRAGQLSDAMLEGGEQALLHASEMVARAGNEGQSLALYTMLERVLPEGPERHDISSHLRALSDWRETTRSDAPMQAAGSEQQVAVNRALFDPSTEALATARRQSVQWIRQAIEYSKEQQPPSTSAERDEALEAYRAVRTGALSIAALYLRHGDAAGALAALEDEDVARVVSPNLHEALRRAADDDDPDAWFELFRTFDRLSEAEPGEVPVEPELSRAAAFGSAVELYRLEPDTMRGIMPLSSRLLWHSMGEVAPLLLEPILEEGPDVRTLSWTMAYLLQAIVNAESVGEIDAARRTFRRAAPFIEDAEQRGLESRITPSTARVYYVMGAIEARAGELTRARAELEKSAKKSRTTEVLHLLAAIDRQRGASMQALESLEGVVELATRAGDITSVADTYLSIFEIQRDIGNDRAAEEALATALRRALDARQLARTGPEQASAERVLARVLEQYGDRDGARRATARAYEASGNDPRQLTVTVLEASRRALTHGDLRAAREAARRALEAHLPDEDVVYVALWLKLLEERLDVPSDGTAEEAFAAVDRSSGWAAVLRAWGSGKLGDAELYEAAKTRVERTEATFYTAMARRASDGDAAALEELKKVAASETIQLVEVTIARDLLAEEHSSLDLSVPSDISIP